MSQHQYPLFMKSHPHECHCSTGSWANMAQSGQPAILICSCREEIRSVSPVCQKGSQQSGARV